MGASGVAWALHQLQAAGAVKLRRSYRDDIDPMLASNREWLSAQGCSEADRASYLMGDTGMLLVSYALAPRNETSAQLERLIAGNLDHPARELMWGAPGTMLAALFLHRSTRERRWADLFVASARKLWSQLLWSPEHRCRYWTQDMYGYRSTYLGAVHGFAATAAALIQGRSLLDANEWDAWQRCIVETTRATAQRDGCEANWPPLLHPLDSGWRPPTLLMQFCHGAPGFVIALAGMPAEALDDDLLAAGEAIWNAGPLAKGSNLCHGTGGNGYAFLKLYQRTRDARWLTRARAFAMHGIAQTHAHAERYGQMRYSLWTGDVGFAIYLWDCIRGAGAFPTLDTFFADP
jgi:lantibiotic modifying enzyme